MSERRGRGRPKETETDTSALIARSALLHFAAQGYDATSLREIAGAAGVDVALVAYRFGGKEGLWKAIVSQAARDLHTALQAAEADRAPVERLRHAMRSFIAYLLDRPEVPRLLLRDITIDSERSQWLLDELSSPLHSHFYDLAVAAAGNCVGKAPDHLQFRVANFIYGAASAVARRERLTRLVDGIGDDATFAAALEATLVEGALRCE
ncbi:TetR/AcrR family transcriptional regulator [Sphingomonas sp.]|uniref:TetR/AcrR family transcriptional regulator n=1 Tax=Sphingomonas sp. TaxID=28214 RepID=UPI003BACD61C